MSSPVPTPWAALAWLWLGAALLFTLVVAPAAFAVLPTRALAGLLVGAVLPVLFWSGVVVGAVLTVTSSGWRRAAALALLLSTAAAQLGVGPRIAGLRAELGTELDQLPADDARRVAFGRLHAVSVALLGVGMVGAASVALGGLGRRGRRERSPAAVAHLEPRGGR